MNSGVKRTTRVIRVKLTLSTLVSAIALIGVRAARNNISKVGKIRRSPKVSCKSRWVLKEDSTLGLYL